MRKAFRFLKLFPGARFAFGNYPRLFPGSEKIESELKHRLFQIPEDAIELDISNSVTEAQKIHEATRQIGFEPKCILVVSGQLHSRSDWVIWQKEFPNAKILVSCISYKQEIDRDHIIPAQRNLILWTLANVGRQILLRIVGPERIASIHHYHRDPSQ